MGHAYQGLNFERSIYYYEKCIENDKDYFKAYVNLGNVYKNVFKDYYKALEYYDYILDKKPLCVEALINKASTLHKLKEYEKSEEYFNRALDCNEKIDVIYSEWGQCFREDGDEHTAQEKFIEANKLNPLSSSNNHNMFISYLILGQKFFALNKYHFIVELNNNDINIQSFLICEFDEYGYFDIAINLLDELILEKEYEEIALINKAKILINNEKFLDATEIINSVIDKSNDKYILSDAYGLKGEMSQSYDDSLANYNKSIEYNSKNIPTYFNLGKLHLEEGLTDKAIEIYREILAIDSNNIKALMILHALTKE